MPNMLKLTTIEVVWILTLAQLRPFSKSDWCAFAGCESDSPLIGEFHVNVCGALLPRCVILDGAHLEVYDSQGSPFAQGKLEVV